MDCFVPRDDAKRQWGQSPERTTPPHPDMQCRVFILRWADSCMPQPEMPASAQANVGMRWLLDWQSKPLLPPRRNRNIILPLAGLWKSRNFALSFCHTA